MLYQIIVVDDDDELYTDNESQRALALSLGKISLRTCFRTVRLPGSYILKLAQQSYSAGTEPTSFRSAFNNWLLCELLGGIGGYGGNV